jgi:general secretion pathway protein A
MINYREFWGLQQTPFEAIADPGFFFESHAHGEALARLLYFAADRGMGLAALTGEIGAGKTITLNALKGKLRPDLYVTVEIKTANLGFEDILIHLNASLQGSVAATRHSSRYELTLEFQRLMQEKVIRYGRHCLVMVDEAQMLAPDVLDGLRGLTNYNEPGQAALSIVLSGQPEMKSVLRALPQVYQRVGLFYHLDYLSRDEVLPYLQHRLLKAGATEPEVFDGDCLSPLFDFSRGCPRQINRICKLAVDRTCLLRESRIHAKLLQLIISDFEKQYE